jgi:hypothetical protein
VVQVFIARAVMILTGAWIAYIGYTLLTVAIAIPATLVLWFIAAATIALGARGKIQHGWGGFNADHLLRDERPPSVEGTLQGGRHGNAHRT